MKKYKYTQTFTFEGHRYYVHADTAKELGAKMALKKRELQEGTPTSDMTVRDWANHAIRTYKTRQSPVTREKYMKRVNHNVLEHIGWMKLKDVKPVKLQEVINLTAGYSQRHINEVYQIIGFIFSTAHDNNLIRTNPAKGITRPGGTRSQVRSMTEEERTAFLKVHKDPRFRVFSLMYYCGCRPSEAMEARAEDVQTLGNMHVLHIHGTKTRNADRIVPIHTDLYDLIHNSTGYIADHHGEKHSRTSYRRITDRLYREMDIAMGAETYRNHIVTSKLSQDFHPYCLRHTFCTDLARKGIDIRTAQKLMGHADIQTTVNIYTHIDESFIEDVGAVMGAVRVQHGCNTL